MKIETITFTQRFNLGNYEHIEISAAARVEDPSKAQDAMDSLRIFVGTALNKKLQVQAPAPAPAPAPVEQPVVEQQPVVAEEPKKEKKTRAKKEKVEEVKEEVVEEAPAKSSLEISYDSSLQEHKSILGGYLSKKYGNAWKTAKSPEKIRAFTMSLNGKPFVDESGNIVESFLGLIHEFFGA